MLLSHTCTIQAHDGSVNALNEPDPDGWSDSLTGVLCRFKDNVQREPTPQDAATLLSPYLLLLAADTAVTSANRIANVVTPDGTLAGPFRIAEGPYRRRDGRGRTRHLSLGLEKTEAA